MVSITTAIIAVVALAAAILLALVLRAVVRFRGTRVVTCPETNAPVAVEIDLRVAALTAAVGDPVFLVTDCSRWPEKRGCDRACLRQIEDAPEECLIRKMVERWHEGRGCVLCRRPIPPIPRRGRKSVLLAADGRLVEWADVAPEQLAGVLATHLPLCGDCLIFANFLSKCLPLCWMALGAERFRLACPAPSPRRIEPFCGPDDS